MSRPSSSSSSTWTRGSDTNWTIAKFMDDSIVHPSKIILQTLKVQVMTTEPRTSISPHTEDAVLKKRYRVRKWIKTSITWCMRALTLSCLWKKCAASTESYTTTTCQGHALESKPTISTNTRGNSSSIEFVAVQSPTKKNPQTRSDQDDKLPQDDDDWTMRCARLAAREIEWCGEKLMPPRPDVVKKSGIWSNDEHERYCEALELYRYGSWKQIAAHVGSRTERQVLSHAQSIRARKKKEEGILSKPRPVVQETRKLSPEELLVASMTHIVPANLPSNVNHHFDVLNTSVDTTTQKFPPWGLNFELNFPFDEEFDVKTTVDSYMANADEETKSVDDFQPSNKRSKPNSDTGVTFDTALPASPLNLLLDGILSDEDLLEFLEIPFIQSQVQSAI